MTSSQAWAQVLLALSNPSNGDCKTHIHRIYQCSPSSESGLRIETVARRDMPTRPAWICEMTTGIESPERWRGRKRRASPTSNSRPTAVRARASDLSVSRWQMPNSRARGGILGTTALMTMTSLRPGLDLSRMLRIIIDVLRADRGRRAARASLRSVSPTLVKPTRSESSIISEPTAVEHSRRSAFTEPALGCPREADIRIVGSR